MKSINPIYFSTYASLEISKLLEMAGSVKIYSDSLKEDINIIERRPEEWDIEYDELAQLNEINEISVKLSVIGLYMILERITKKIINFYMYLDLDEPERVKKLRSLYKWNNVVSELNVSARVNVAELRDFPTINELRCLNNAIKHSGYVDAELARFTIWENELDKEIKPELIDLDRFGEAIPKYIYDLAYIVRKNQPSPS